MNWTQLACAVPIVTIGGGVEPMEVRLQSRELLVFTLDSRAAGLTDVPSDTVFLGRGNHAHGYETFVFDPALERSLRSVCWADSIDRVPIVLGRVSEHVALVTDSGRVKTLDIISGRSEPLLQSTAQSSLLEFSEQGVYVLRPSALGLPAALYSWAPGETSATPVPTAVALGRFLGVTTSGFWFRSFDLSSVVCVNRDGGVESSHSIDPASTLKRRHCAPSSDGKFFAFASTKSNADPANWDLRVFSSDSNEEIYRSAHSDAHLPPTNVTPELALSIAGELSNRNSFGGLDSLSIRWISPTLLFCRPPPTAGHIPFLDFSETNAPWPTAALSEFRLSGLPLPGNAQETVLGPYFATRETTVVRGRGTSADTCLMFLPDRHVATCGLGGMRLDVCMSPSGFFAAVARAPGPGPFVVDLLLVDGRSRVCHPLMRGVVLQVAWLSANGPSSREFGVLAGAMGPAMFQHPSDGD